MGLLSLVPAVTACSFPMLTSKLKAKTWIDISKSGHDTG